MSILCEGSVITLTDAEIKPCKTLENFFQEYYDATFRMPNYISRSALNSVIRMAGDDEISAVDALLCADYLENYKAIRFFALLCAQNKVKVPEHLQQYLCCLQVPLEDLVFSNASLRLRIQLEPEVLSCVLQNNEMLVELCVERGHHWTYDVWKLHTVQPYPVSVLSRLLVHFASTNRTDNLRDLLRLGADPKLQESKSVRRAAWNAQTDAIRVLCESDPNVEKDHALAIASLIGAAEIVRFLLSKGANPHIENELPLRWAANTWKTPVVEILLENGADLDEGIRHARENQQVHALKVLLLQKKVTVPREKCVGN